MAANPTPPSLSNVTRTADGSPDPNVVINEPPDPNATRNVITRDTTFVDHLSGVLQVTALTITAHPAGKNPRRHALANGKMGNLYDFDYLDETGLHSLTLFIPDTITLR